jgi:hypothetical protein
MKEIEKARKLGEEREEEERIRREQERLRIQYEQEENNKNKKRDMYQAENYNLIQMKKENEAKSRHDNNQVNQSQQFQQYANNNQMIDQQQFNPNPNNLFINEEDMNMRTQLNNEILNLKNIILEQQNTLLTQINDLKAETNNANLQRYETLKEINYIKEELAKQKVDDDMRKKYIYDVILQDNNRVDNIFKHSILPEVTKPDLQSEFNRKHSEELHKLTYDNKIKYPNRVPVIPKLDEIKETEFESESKFINVDNYNITNVIHINIEYKTYTR